MHLSWHDSTLDVPCYARVHGGRLIRIEVARPLVRIGDASGRVFPNPWRKVAAFLQADGPIATFRKARSKLREHRYNGDYHVVLVLGTCVATQVRVVALMCRAPKNADYMVTHGDLLAPVPETFGSAELDQVANRLLVHGDQLDASGRQTYLYSDQDPPTELRSLFRDGLQFPLETFEAEGVSESLLDSMAGPVQSPSSETPLDFIWRSDPRKHRDALPVVVLGAGDYARTEILPMLRSNHLVRWAVADREPQIAALVAGQFDFAISTTDPYAAINTLPRPGLVIVATYHDSHANLAASALKKGHRVFLEKPAVVTEEDLDLLLEATRGAPDRMEVGFNRRYHPLVIRARDALASESGPTIITCVVREVDLRPDHWYFWPNQGTRITGNLCHWIDLGVFLLPTRPIPQAVQISKPHRAFRAAADADLALSVSFADGSLLTIVATDQGDGTRGVQEWIQARRGSATITLDDLREFHHAENGRSRAKRTVWRHRGHREMYEAALGRALRGENSQYPRSDLVTVSEIHIAAAQLVNQGDLSASLSDRVRKRLAELNNPDEGRPSPYPSVPVPFSVGH